MTAATLYIDGCWVAPTHRNRFSSINPATEMKIQLLVAASPKEVDKAVTAARCAFEGDWGRTRGSERAGFP